MNKSSPQLRLDPSVKDKIDAVIRDEMQSKKSARIMLLSADGAPSKSLREETDRQIAVLRMYEAWRRENPAHSSLAEYDKIMYENPTMLPVHLEILQRGAASSPPPPQSLSTSALPDASFPAGSPSLKRPHTQPSSQSASKKKASVDFGVPPPKPKTKTSKSPKASAAPSAGQLLSLTSASSLASSFSSSSSSSSLSAAAANTASLPPWPSYGPPPANGPPCSVRRYSSPDHSDLSDFPLLPLVCSAWQASKELPFPPFTLRTFSVSKNKLGLKIKTVSNDVESVFEVTSVNDSCEEITRLNVRPGDVLLRIAGQNPPRSVAALVDCLALYNRPIECVFLRPETI